MVLPRRVGRIFFGHLRSQMFSRNIIWLISDPEEPNNFGLRTLARRPSIIAALRLYSALDFICSDILKLCTLTTNMSERQQRPIAESNEAGNSNLNLSGF